MDTQTEATTSLVGAPEADIDLDFSVTIGALTSALAKAHKKFKAVKKGEYNPFFKSKYADLAEVLDATEDSLSDNELAVIQSPGTFSEGKVKLTTILAHSSGEWIKSVLYMPVAKPDAQGLGSAITYARRYAYSAIVNVASEADDDGNAAVAGKKGRDEVIAERLGETDEEFDQRTEGQRLVSAFQVKAFEDACRNNGKSPDQALVYLNSTFKVNHISEVTRHDFNAAIRWASKPETNYQDLTAKLTESIDKIKAKKSNGGVQSKCYTHGVYQGDGDCPKCAAQ